MNIDAPTQIEGKAVRLFVFDFDQTLSACHVFKALVGAGPLGLRRLRPPHTKTELGQVMRIFKSDQSGEFQAEGGFAVAAFGGRDRVEKIRALLEDLKAVGAVLVVCTRGLRGTVCKVLSDLDMLTYFSQVYGVPPNHYGSDLYEQTLNTNTVEPHVASFLSDNQGIFLHDKGRLAAQLLQDWGLEKEHAVLIEDDSDEINLAKPFCRTLWVREAKGIDEHHCRTLRAMAAGRGRFGSCCPGLFPLLHA
uniref:Uncharacterized protein n=1 Tax=Pyrodinium bahamense TaxID=73915 RepID=A0A7S0G098_9DINO